MTHPVFGLSYANNHEFAQTIVSVLVSVLLIVTWPRFVSVDGGKHRLVYVAKLQPVAETFYTSRIFFHCRRLNIVYFEGGGGVEGPVM